MIPKIQMVQSPNIDWESFIKFSQSNFNFSPTRVLDSRRIILKDPRAFLYALGSLFYNKENLQILQLTSKHLFFSFIIHYDLKILTEMFISSDFKINYKDNIFYVTGSLYSWYNWSLIYANKNYSFDYRILSNFIIMYFDKLGLRRIWDNYQRYTLIDNSFILERKKK